MQRWILSRLLYHVKRLCRKKEGVTIRRPLDGYRDRVAVWHLVINSPTQVEISAVIYTIII